MFEANACCTGVDCRSEEELEVRLQHCGCWRLHFAQPRLQHCVFFISWLMYASLVLQALSRYTCGHRCPRSFKACYVRPCPTQPPSMDMRQTLRAWRRCEKLCRCLWMRQLMRGQLWLRSVQMGAVVWWCVLACTL